MDEARVEILRDYSQGCDLFASLLLDLPNADLVEKMMQMRLSPKSEVESEQDSKNPDDTGEIEDGGALVDAYVRSCDGRATQDILQELSVDRTRLLCGLTKSGPRPPYESLYLGAVANETALSVTASYRTGQCKMDESIKNAPDHLGVELSFLSELCEREASALENGDKDGAKATRELAASFMKDHPGRWAADFADEMLKFATTDFYRGIAYLLKSFVTEGKLLFA